MLCIALMHLIIYGRFHIMYKNQIPMTTTADIKGSLVQPTIKNAQNIKIKI